MKYLSRHSCIKEYYGYTNSTSTQGSHLVADGKKHAGAFSELTSWQRPDRVKKKRKPVYLVSEQSLNSKQNLEQHEPNLSQIPPNYRLCPNMSICTCTKPDTPLLARQNLPAFLRHPACSEQSWCGHRRGRSVFNDIDLQKPDRNAPLFLPSFTSKQFSPLPWKCV